MAMSRLHALAGNGIIFAHQTNEVKNMDSITDNSYRTLWGFIKAAGAPDYVANGILVDEKDAADLSDMAFADPTHRRFPITDRANTWASAGYFAKTAGEYDYSPAMYGMVKTRIEKAAELYGIREDVDKLVGLIRSPVRETATQKAASDDLSNYCDPETRGFPVFDEEGVKLANDFFTQNAYRYGYGKRMEIAKNIMKKCAEYGVKAAHQVKLSAGDGFPNRALLAENLLFRADYMMNRDMEKGAAAICKLAKEICVCSDDDLFDNREGLFRAIGGLDELNGLDDDYGTRFMAPEELVFDITPEEVKEKIDDAVPLGNETFSAKALSELPRRLFEQVLPKDKVDGMFEDGKISPKKLSITIISSGKPEHSHLLQTIRDFTDGKLDFDEDDAEGGVIDIKDEDEGKEKSKDEGKDEGKED